MDMRLAVAIRYSDGELDFPFTFLRTFSDTLNGQRCGHLNLLRNISILDGKLCLQARSPSSKEIGPCSTIDNYAKSAVWKISA